MALIDLQNVRVEFPIYNSKSRSMQLWLYERLGGKMESHNKRVVVRAIDGLNLRLEDGDRLGIVGHNGAGKTTLLRVVSRVYPPTSGQVTIEGSISALTDMTMGMDSEANGYDNIVFRCVFMGMGFREAKARTREIAEFSELGNYLELPVRTYSTGMFLRLAFAISTAITPDILVLDEMLSAGDLGFQKRAEERIHTLLEHSKILVIAAHDLSTIEKLCNKVIWMEHGNIRAAGSPAEVLAEYRAQ